MFTIQDPLHCAKKIRNQVLLTETWLLQLGYWENTDEAFRVVIRWDLMFDLAIKVPEFLLMCSKSAINLLDKQDPSLVGELSAQYQLFLDNGYHGMGIYLKALQLFLEAFLDPDLCPTRKIQKAWYTKNSQPTEFVSRETFTDIKCAIDGLFLYMVLLMKEFPESPIVPQYLGSDINELVYAFVRIGMYYGRRSNMEALRLAQGMEKRNAYTNILKNFKDEGFAHSRGRHILQRVTTEEPNENNITYKGKDIILQDIIKAMKQGTADCLADGNDFKLSYLRDSDHLKLPISKTDTNLYENECCDVFEYHFGIESLETHFEDFHESAGKEMVTTPMGTFDRRRVEAYYLNQGRSSTASKARPSRFYANEYNSSKLELYARENFCLVDDCTSTTFLKKGDVVTLFKFHRKNASEKPTKITGTTLYMSKNHTPYRSVCKEHSSGLNVWLHNQKWVH